MNAAGKIGILLQMNSVVLLVREDVLAGAGESEGLLAPFGVGADVVQLELVFFKALDEGLEVCEAAEGALRVVEIGVDIGAGLFDLGVFEEDGAERVARGGVEVEAIAELPRCCPSGERSLQSRRDGRAWCPRGPCGRSSRRAGGGSSASACLAPSSVGTGRVMGCR